MFKIRKISGLGRFGCKKPMVEIFVLAAKNNNVKDHKLWLALHHFNKRLRSPSSMNVFKIIPNLLSVTGIIMQSDETDQKKALGIDLIIENDTILFDDEKIENLLRSIKLPNSQNDLFTILTEKQTHSSIQLLCILLPDDLKESEAEFFFETNNKPYLIFTSMHQHWEQVVLRAFYKSIGLGDEYVSTENEYLQPSILDGDMIDFYHFNLIHFYSKNDKINIDNFKWFSLLSSTINKIDPNKIQSNADYNSRNYSPEGIQLWEGGGNYQTKIFRSAQDCLMRRKIGDKSNSIRKEIISLCPICEIYVRAKITHAAQLYSEDFLEFRHSLISDKS